MFTETKLDIIFRTNWNLVGLLSADFIRQMGGFIEAMWLCSLRCVPSLLCSAVWTRVCTKKTKIARGNAI